MLCLFTDGLCAPDETAASLIREAQASLAAGAYVAVVKSSTSAAELFRKAGDGTGQGQALNLLGLAQLYSGSYAPTLESFHTSLDLARKTGDPSSEVVRLNNIGNVFYFQGRYSDALDRYQEAGRRVEVFAGEDWAVARRQLTKANTAILYQTLGQYERALALYNELLNAPKALPVSEHAQLLANVGTLRRRLGDPRKALDTYLEAQALYRKAANKDGEIAVLNNIGIVHAMDLKDYAAAAATFTSALQLANATGNRPMEVHAHLYRGETYFRAGRIQDSWIDFQAAADQALRLGEIEERWKALYGLGRIRAQRGDTGTSDKLLNEAVAAIESLRAGLKKSSLRSDFLADKRDVYDLLIEHKTDAEDVFRLMEQSRARNLQDRMQLAPLPALQDVARRLPADTALMEYWIGPASASVLWLSRNGHGMRRWNLTPDDAKLLAALPSVLADASRTDWRAAAERAASQLLADAPALQRAGIKRLVIVPDDVLTGIPFEALPVNASELLIQQFSVSYLPSAKLLAEHRAGPRNIRWPWDTTLEAFADPRSSGGQPKVDAAGGRIWAPLPEAEREVTGIARAIGGRAAIYIGERARKDLLMRSKPAPLLHFATHAFADMNDPARSYILFAPADRAQSFDHLYLGEVDGLSLNQVDLVTASACETDAGKLVRGEGVQSFSRAFLAAGARSIVTSLWAVSDRDSAALMLRFYSRLAKGDYKSDALRTAKLEALGTARSAHPAHWAAFILNGESNAPIPYVVSWSQMLVAGLLLASVAILIRSFVVTKPARRG